MFFPYDVFDGQNRIIDFEYNENITLSEVEVDDEFVIVKRSDDGPDFPDCRDGYKHRTVTCLVIVCDKRSTIDPDDDKCWDMGKKLYFLSTKDGIYRITNFNSEKDIFYFEKHSIVLHWRDGYFPDFVNMPTEITAGKYVYQK